MRREIRRIEPVRFANVVAIVYALMFLVFAVLAVPFLLLVPMSDTSGGASELGFMVGFLLLYPFLVLIFVWLSGWLSAAIYNLVAGWIGGILIELGSEAMSSGEVAA